MKTAVPSWCKVLLECREKVCRAVGVGRFARRTMVWAVVLLFSGICPKARAAEVEAGFGKIKLTGLMQGWYEYKSRSGSINSNFRARRAEIKFSGTVHDRVYWFTMADPAQVREDATRKSPLQDFGVGANLGRGIALEFHQAKVPFGMEGYASSVKIHTIERGLITTEFSWADKRDIGVMFKGDWQFKNSPAKIGLDLGVYNGAGQNNFDVKNRKDFAFRLRGIPASWLYLDAAHYRGWTGTTNTDNFRTGGAVALEKDPFLFTSELVGGRDSDKSRMAWYLLAGYKIVPKLQVVGRYDWADPDKAKSNDLVREATLGFNWFILKTNAKFSMMGVLRQEQSKTPVNSEILRTQIHAAF